DFVKNAESERVKINAYVASATHGKIKELFAKGVIDSFTRMVLVNAIWFKGDWVTPFDPGSQKGSFTRLDGSSVQVPMMTDGTASRGLLHTNASNAAQAPRDYQAVELPYVGGASMVVIEPDPGKFAAVEKQFGPAMLGAFDRESQPVGYGVSMPKFSFSSQFTLNDTLSAMGMSDAFDDRANFSGISNAGLYVSAVVHQATITVDEKGTEAAAATGVVLIPMSAHLGLAVNHPFLFAIRDDKTGAILFTGRVLDPTQH
ncbi:MAG TPA: serpin family protein, partial [Acidimicrobiia bacterium]